MRGPIRAPILLPFGNRNTPAEPHRAVPCAAKPGHACQTSPRLAVPSASGHACHVIHRQTLPTRPAVPRLSGHTGPRHACHANPDPSKPRHACHACHAPHSVPTRRCLPRLSLARPRLACRALPRSASPTSPNQQRRARASTRDHALPAMFFQAGSCRTSPAMPSTLLPCQSSHACRSCPDLAKPCLAPPATPTRLGRADLSGPCLPIQSDPRQCSGPCLPRQFMAAEGPPVQPPPAAPLRRTTR
jgi:hypothetical protein